MGFPPPPPPLERHRIKNLNINQHPLGCCPIIFVNLLQNKKQPDLSSEGPSGPGVPVSLLGAGRAVVLRSRARSQHGAAQRGAGFALLGDDGGRRGALKTSEEIPGWFGCRGGVAGESKLSSRCGDGRDKEKPPPGCRERGMSTLSSICWAPWLGKAKSWCGGMGRVVESHRVPLGACGMAPALLRSIAVLGGGSGALQRVEGTGLAPGVPTGDCDSSGEPQRASAPILRGGCEHTRAEETCVRPHVPALLALPCPEPSLCPQTSP